MHICVGYMAEASLDPSCVDFIDSGESLGSTIALRLGACGLGTSRGGDNSSACVVSVENSMYSLMNCAFPNIVLREAKRSSYIPTFVFWLNIARKHSDTC